MKTAKLMHNPKAGDKVLSKKELVEFIESGGWKCRYSSTKEEGWDEIHPETDFIIVAGGDGTVRKAAAQILERKMLDKKLPIALLPMGTANNISKTLGISGDLSGIIQSWSANITRSFDIGKTEGLELAFFLESLGAGVFPRLMKEMQGEDKSAIENPEQELKMALQKLHNIILSYEARYCKIEIDGAFHSGKLLMMEVMNTRSVGPNLNIAPNADPGDGQFEVVLVPEERRNELADYVLALLNGQEAVFSIEPVKGAEISLEWDSPHLHVDDVLIKIEKNTPVKIILQAGVLDFLIPEAIS